jgi:hypothetical protein
MRRVRRLGSERAGNEIGGRRQQAADGGTHVRMVERQEGHGGLGPDEVRDAGKVVDLAGRIGGRQAHVVEEDAALVLGPPFLALRHARLDDADLDARNERRRRGGKAKLTEHGKHGNRQERDGERREPRAPAGDADDRVAPQDRRQREDDDGKEREPVDAQHARALHEGEGPGQRIAQHIPGKARQHMPARPFHGGEGECQHQYAGRPPAPEARGKPGGGGVEQGEARRHRGDGERQQRREDFRLDQKSITDPEQARQEIAEAEPPADGRGGKLRAPIPARQRIGGRVLRGSPLTRG